jgi:hypothetical protein
MPTNEDTGTLADRLLSEVPQHDANGFAIAHPYLHRETNTLYGPDGFNIDGFNLSGFDREGYDERGFNENNLHRETGTHYHPVDHLTWDRGRYSEDNNDLDWRGRDRCDNGECEDMECESCNPPDDDEEPVDASFNDRLDSYGEKAPRKLGWSDHSHRTFDGEYVADRTLYAGHEIEMYADDEDYSSVEHVLDQLNSAYRNFKPQTRTLRCAIAKYDGSLEYKDGGFEAVTVPLTREQTYGIFGSFRVLGGGSCSAWDCGPEVGHHIHLSRAAIGPLTLGKLLVFANVECNQLFIERVAGRKADYNTFASKKLTDAMHDRPNADRHEVINVTNHTVEFRMFKSNLLSRGILKNYEFAVSLVRYCEQVDYGNGEEPEDSDHPLHYLSYRRWLAAKHAEYPYLHQFFLSHGSMARNYRQHAGLAKNAVPTERSPKFALIRTSAIGA